MLERGDQACMRMIFEDHYNALCRYAMRYLFTFDDAEDVVQSVLISFWNNRRGTHFTGSVTSYLFAAVAKSALKRIRDDRKAYFADIEAFADELADAVPVEDEAATGKLRSSLEKVIAALPDNQRRVLFEIAVNGKRYKTVAQEMDISVNTVKTHYSRSLRSLREMKPDHG